MNVPWSPPDLGNAEMEAAKKVIDSGWLTQGKETAKFEEIIRDYIGCKHAIVVNNGTSALIAALLAHGIGQGDEVIVPTYTFIASVNAIIAVGATPVLVDSDAKIFNTTPALMEAVITPNTKAILPVDVAGMPIDIEGFRALAEKHKLILIEDAAEAMGAEYKGKKIGSFDHTAIFSFHMAKLATCIEGGCVLTNDDEIAEQCRMIRSHGEKEKYQFATFGLNLRTTDIQSAIGQVQVGKIDSYVTLRNRLVKIYKDILGDLVSYQEEPEYVTKHPYMIFGILVDVERRDALITHLNEQKIGTRICWPPTHTQQYHKKLFSGSYPVAEELGKRVINLPMGNGLTEEQIIYVAETLKKALEAKP